MSSIVSIKNEVKRLFETNPNIHISVKMSRPKLNVSCRPAVIKGVYPNIFRVEENSDGHLKCHSLQYSEILTGQIEISELAEFLKNENSD